MMILKPAQVYDMAKTKQTRNAERLRNILDKAIRLDQLEMKERPGGRRRAIYTEKHMMYTPSSNKLLGPIKQIVLEVCYEPDVFNKQKDLVQLYGCDIDISHQAYKNTIRKLSEWEIMKKLES